MFESYLFAILGPNVILPPSLGRGRVIGAMPAFFPVTHSTQLSYAANSDGFMLLALTSTHARHELEGNAWHETTAGEVAISGD